MSESLKNTHRWLQLVFIVTLLLGFALFVGTTLLRLREILHGTLPHVTLERYGILVTLVGIPGALKAYHYFMKKNPGHSEQSNLNFYVRIYFLRLMILGIVLLVNLLGLYITGGRNFFYMIFITLVAFLICLPNKSEIVTLCEIKNDIQQ
jgi:hypothetical protein